MESQSVVSCRVCGGRTSPTHRGRVLAKYEVTYHLCAQCEFWFTDEPFWLDEAYSEAIAATDTGLVARNFDVANRLRVILRRLFPRGPYVDWAGGHGMLARMMRDSGLDFYWQDKYAKNLFARTFEWPPSSGARATVVTAIEVLEHCADPVAFLDDCIESTGAAAVLFSQELHTGAGDASWWYLSPITGQHVSFFSEITLCYLAERLGMSYSRVAGLHLFSREPIPLRRRLITNGLVAVSGRIARLAARVVRTPAPLTWSDHLAITHELEGGRGPSQNQTSTRSG